jgi:hypothetical protein
MLSRRQNGEDIEEKCPPQAVILPARAFCFEIDAILTSCGFDPFCPVLRWQARKYRHIPVARRLALNKMASNLESILNGSGP